MRLRIPVGTPVGIPRTVSRTIPLGFDRFSGLYLWALFIAIFAIWTPDLFLTSGTLHSVASAQAVVAMMALAIVIPLSCGTYDLSIGATVNFTTVLVSVLQTQKDLGMWPSIAVAVAAAAVIGVVNALLVVKVGISSFIGTLGTATIIGAVQTIVSGQSQPLPPTASQWLNLTQRTILGFQVIVFYLIALALILWWVMAHTPVGRYIYATGGNYEAARLSGVPVARTTWWSLVASSTICGIAGVLYASLSGPSLSFGPALLLPAYAAAFLGQTQLTPGRFNVWGTLIAVYALATGVKGLQLVTSVGWLSDMFNGVALVAAVGFAVINQRRVRGNARPAEAAGSNAEAGTIETTSATNASATETSSAKETSPTEVTPTDASGTQTSTEASSTDDEDANGAGVRSAPVTVSVADTDG